MSYLLVALLKMSKKKVIWSVFYLIYFEGVTNVLILGKTDLN